MSTRAEALARRIEEGAASLAALAQGLSEEQWTAVVPPDGRTVGVIVHHVASMYAIEVQLAQELAAGRAIEGVTWDAVADINARHAQAHADVTRHDAVDALIHASRAAADAVRRLSDEQLDRAAPVSLNGDAPLTAQFFIEGHALSHSWHHLAKIRRALAAVTPPCIASARSASASARAIGAIAGLVLSLTSPAGARAQAHDHGARVPSTLVQTVRDVTRPYVDVNIAQAQGYGPAFGCVSGPQEGAMGVHYINGALVGDGAPDAAKPEALMYEISVAEPGCSVSNTSSTPRPGSRSMAALRRSTASCFSTSRARIGTDCRRSSSCTSGRGRKPPAARSLTGIPRCRVTGRSRRSERSAPLL